MTLECVFLYLGENMNFFEHQERAERKTVLLVVLYLLAVVLTFCATHLIASFAYELAGAIIEEEHGHRFEMTYAKYFDYVENPAILIFDLGAILLIIGGGTLHKMTELNSKGGDGVAQSLGGVRVTQATASLKEKRLLNIVEEMAIAAGIHVPNVYVLREEQGINAFAAGFTPATSVVAVTQGALEYLTRDELQGVLAHEFSHILHRDTNLNLKLIGILHGLELLFLCGVVLLFCLREIAPVFRGGGKNKGSAIIAIVMLVMFILGIGFSVIGFIGMVFALIIRSAVSRQREFLADASAVQYTRNPDGIVGALKKIGSSVGGEIKSEKAIETSHIFFGSAVPVGLGFLLDSHPSLTARIKRIDPSFNGVFRKELQKVIDYTNVNEESSQKQKSFREFSKLFPLLPAITVSGMQAPERTAAVAGAILSNVGTVTQDKLCVADALLEKIPQEVDKALVNRFGAIGAFLAVLIDKDPFGPRDAEISFLERNLDKTTFAHVKSIADTLESCPCSVKIPIVQKAFPFLRNLSKSEYIALRKTISTLMKFDGRISILEFTIAGFMVNDLDIYFKLAPAIPEKYRDLNQIAEPFRKVASAMAYAGSDVQTECANAFANAAHSLGIQTEILPKEECVPAEFSASVRELTFASKPLRQKILTALYSCIAFDGYINEQEGELIRAVTAHFQCPMPTWGE